MEQSTAAPSPRPAFYDYQWEIWFDCGSAPDDYEVSNRGAFRNKKTGRILKKCRRCKAEGDGKSSRGRPSVNFMVGPKGKRRSISVYTSREAFFSIHPNVSSLLQIRHKDDDCWNDAIWNLEAGTHADNMADKRRRKRAHGPGKRVLTVERVLLLKLDRRAGMSQRARAEKYGVTKSQVQNIDRGVCWARVVVPDESFPLTCVNQTDTTGAPLPDAGPDS